MFLPEKDKSKQVDVSNTKNKSQDNSKGSAEERISAIESVYLCYTKKI